MMLRSDPESTPRRRLKREQMAMGCSFALIMIRRHASGRGGGGNMSTAKPALPTKATTDDDLAEAEARKAHSKIHANDKHKAVNTGRGWVTSPP